METDLGGIKLFEKVGRNIRLTNEGRFFREKVDAALQELQSASMTLRESRLSAPVVVRMGYVSGSLTGTAAQTISAYLKKNPRVRFSLTESSAERLMDLVREEEIDMAIVDLIDRDRSLHFRKLQEQDFFVALPLSHPLAQEEMIDPQTLSKEPQIAFNYDVGKSFREWATGTPTEENILCVVNTAEAALDLVAAGAGISFIPGSCLRPRDDITYRPLKKLASSPLYVHPLQQMARAPHLGLRRTPSPQAPGNQPPIGQADHASRHLRVDPFQRYNRQIEN